ncbi:putative F-box domain-containing protein [Helianthus annuus]|uniref:F-box domain-containing protein n=1 Tax=Helianthus annuus TaxID=4232 RepID=A0A251TB85_HELAN|nr:putative F-box domain-containing protein [Helianthus annuus]KAJ0549065.1 putative F-box domain-containing protein [Helianthus annuus]KAJ0555314.1 putative F-box domain-containing protein [Helianthus annuus]KAJ0562006.1 putative F-box domain-containing protein [Helianthus annuus]KAJ0727401.1 putative F-box domain-containing protein [Helianthus annuus]
MALLPIDLQKEILKRLNVRDLIRSKGVCKLWSSWISDPHFIKVHLNHHYHKDRNKKRIGDRRIIVSKDSIYLTWQFYDGNSNFFTLNDRHLFGSSNGLVCVSPSPTKILVINPSTREVKKVRKPQIPETNSLCWGFGYDSSTDDYKLVLGFKKDENHTCFQVFSLRSNIWKVIGEINYVFASRVGILCKGSLHWLAYDTLSEKDDVILSLRLSDGKFLEVPKPDDVRYQLYNGQHSSMRLGTMEENLCLFGDDIYTHEVWVRKDYNKQQCWEIFGPDHEIKNDVVHSIKLLKHYIPNKRPLCHQIWSGESRLCKNLMFYGTPLYVESLVSPHFHKKPQRKRRASSTIRNPKVCSNCVYYFL